MRMFPGRAKSTGSLLAHPRWTSSSAARSPNGRCWNISRSPCRSRSRGRTSSTSSTATRSPSTSSTSSQLLVRCKEGHGTLNPQATRLKQLSEWLHHNERKLLFELLRLGRDKQLEQELPFVVVQPFGQLLQARRLPGVQRAVTLRVEADEHLAERGLEVLDVLANASPYSKSNSSCPDFSTGMASVRCSSSARRRSPRRTARPPRCRRRPGRHRLRAHPGSPRRSPPWRRRCERVLRRRRPLDPEELLNERAAMIEGQDEQVSVVAQSQHPGLPSVVADRC